MLVNFTLFILFVILSAALGLILLTFFAILSEFARRLDMRDARKFQERLAAEKALQ